MMTVPLFRQCFGLLGVNGAGKTSTFRMLTGDLYPSYGDALLNSQSVVRDRGHVQASMGYCPQVDALIDQLTGREHLVLIGRLRGLHPPQVNLPILYVYMYMYMYLSV